MVAAVSSFDLFGFYRFVLATLVCVYSVAHVATLIWRWQGLVSGSSGREAAVHRYVELLLLRLQLRRFLPDLIEIAALFGVLVVLLRLHE